MLRLPGDLRWGVHSGTKSKRIYKAGTTAHLSCRLRDVGFLVSRGSCLVLSAQPKEKFRGSAEHIEARCMCEDLMVPP